jgi:pyrroloquinoline quinone biosynthesis protein B
MAVTGDGEGWLVVGASPDLREQLARTPRLWPRNTGRDSPISGVLLTGGDVDAIAGLLVLRERQPFTLYAPASLLDLLSANRIFDVLDPAVVKRVEVRPMEAVACGGNLTLTLLPMPGKVPLYLESRNVTEPEAAPAYAALLKTGSRRVIIASACADISETVRKQLMQADILFFDGTLFTDDEMVVAGLSEKTGRRMGHVPISGPGGTLARLADLPARRIFLHINNTNPILLLGSPERREVEAAGFEVAYDGMEIAL